MDPLLDKKKMQHPSTQNIHPFTHPSPLILYRPISQVALHDRLFVRPINYMTPELRGDVSTASKEH